MAETSHVRWLYRELPELVAQGVLETQAAERLRRHYGDPDMAGGTANRWAIILFSIVGAVLIGGGIILLLAHNWDELTRPMRALISIAPLALTAALGAWILWTGKPGTAWREGVGAAQTLAIGSSIALVAQTYNLGGRFDEFMLTWSLLSLPIAYLLRATCPILLYLVGILVWAGSESYQPGTALWYYPLLAAALPFVWWSARENRYHPRSVLLGWVLAITACYGIGFAAGRVCDDLGVWPAVYGGLFVLLYLTGARWWSEAASRWQRPFQNVGALGAVGLALGLGYGDAWSGVSGSAVNWHSVDSLQAGFQLAAAAIFPLAALVLWVRSFCRRVWSEIMLGAVAFLSSAGWIIAAMYDAVMISAVLFNVYLAAFGIGTLVVGLRARRLGTVNAGMAVLAAVILCRFFDSDLSFIVRGVAFIVVGIGFLSTNLMLLRWKQEGRS